MKITLTGAKTAFLHVLIFTCVLVLLFLMSCEEKIEKPGQGQLTENLTCMGCHTDAESLQLLATPEPPPTSSGGG